MTNVHTQSPQTLVGDRELAGSLISEELLTVLERIFPDTLPPYSTSESEIRRRIAERDVIASMRAMRRDALNLAKRGSLALPSTR